MMRAYGCDRKDFYNYIPSDYENSKNKPQSAIISGKNGVTFA